ncbi:MAG: diguanylate cyclase [Ruminococcus sp.]|nr:diguanylate cyclase [Ruminococcus sp.]
MRSRSTADKMLRATDPAMSYQNFIITFIIVCLVGLGIITTMFNRRIEQHDKELTFDICTLISEKMDSSMKYMSDSVNGCAAMLAGTPIKDDPDMMYENFKSGMNRSSMVSVGIINNDGTVYADENEKEEFRKWGLLESAKDDSLSAHNNGVVISTPYRSGKTGQMVFTIFSGVYLKGEKISTIFMTFPLTELQKMANNESMSDDTEIWLMNRSSDNYVRCSGPDSVIGGWSNFRIYKNELTNKDDYEKWEKALRNGEDFAAVNYGVNGVDYTQVFRRIDFMPGWNVVVRTPSHSLTSTMRPILISIVAFALVLLGIAIALILFLHRKESEEKEVFEKLSSYDPLTRIMNRRAFDTRAQELLSSPNNGRYTFMFVDIDFFKQVNDRFGHEAGDRILEEFAITLSHVFGKDGFAARYGGDEFVVLVKDKNKDEINAMIERARQMLGAIIIDDPQTPDAERFHVHFSAGIASFPKDAGDFEALLRRADDALYKVKEAGRDGYCWYGDDYKKR